MKYLSPYRLASYLLVLFCLGHTAGGMISQQSVGPAGDAVFAQMKAVRFELNGSTCTYYGFWFGFGLTVSAFLILSAVATWTLAAVPAEAWRYVRPIAWVLFLSHAFNTVLAWKYFFAMPGVFSTVITVLMGVEAVRRQWPAAART
jgi:hypothetical protein